ncbi:hypothetical protein OJ996_03480 [Luteolibacter sp. GHJ8]|uniref:Uncharacterized protein n=1 Tax=Luteolibacter rhizosphaerae TaxID=2989719 RepID=A0ABT3FYE9_9BACT|nr:hypothetical protein [Luteolibacter rhizosphaerae]MCW1912621.1 hypothetical protein [Luteolibacter rhizosphaerae]
MAELRFRFIELALRALGPGSPSRELARGELMDRLAHADPAAADDTLEMASARLERGNPRPLRQAALIFSGLLALLGILSMLWTDAYAEIKQLNPHYGFLGHKVRHQKEMEERLSRGMDSEQRLFLFANTRYADLPEVLEWQQSFEQEMPSDPAWLEEAILTSESRDRLLLERLDKFGASLEPDNGFWDLLVALHSKESSPFFEAFTKPRVESHLPARTKLRMEMLGTPRTLAEQVEQGFFVFRQRSWPPQEISKHYIDYTRADNLEAWAESKKIWESWAFRLQPWGSRDTEIHKLLDLDRMAMVMGGHRGGRGQWVDAERFKRVRAVVSRFRALSHGFGTASPPVTDFRREASSIVRNNADQALPGTFTAADFTPGRLAEHAVSDRYMAVCGASLLAFFALAAAFEGWRRLLPRRGLAAGLLPLFRPADVAWTFCLGVLLPFAWHLGITRFTPLGCRHIGLMEWDMMPAMQQAAGSLAFSVCMLQQTLRWRLARRMGVIGLRSPLLWVGWVMAAVAALFVPLIGIVGMLTRHQEPFLVLGSSMLGIPLLWIVWRAGITAVQPQETSFEGILLSRLLVPAYTVAAAVLLLAVPSLQREEQAWVARDHMSGPARDGSLMLQMDAHALASVRAALAEAWQGTSTDPLPAP